MSNTEGEALDLSLLVWWTPANQSAWLKNPFLHKVTVYKWSAHYKPKLHGILEASFQCWGTTCSWRGKNMKHSGHLSLGYNIIMILYIYILSQWCQWRTKPTNPATSHFTLGQDGTTRKLGSSRFIECQTFQDYTIRIQTYKWSYPIQHLVFHFGFINMIFLSHPLL